MHAPVFHTIRNNTFWLSPQRCIFWEEEKALILSDLHLGKTGHFRKQGIAVPQAVYKEDLQRLFAQIQYYQPRQLIIVGDMFHSRQNKELDLFVRWRHDMPNVDVHLVKGNHDILKEDWYAHAQITISEKQLCMGQFLFTHDAQAEACAGYDAPYTFSGHIHPGVAIQGLGRQSLSFPCYFFGEKGAILPAFSKFTGVKVMRKGGGDNVFAIVNQSVIRIA